MSWDQLVIYKDAVDDLLKERGIQEEDVKKVIFQAEKSGRKLYGGDDGGRFLAKARLDRFTVYAEYSARGDGFEIHSVYSHRISINSDSDEQGEV